MRYDVQQLLKMSQRELDALFTASAAGPIPEGQAEGTAIIAPGTVLSCEIAILIKHFVWKGKLFELNAGRLTNRVGPLGFNAVSAKVYKGPSWVDGRECIVLDYSKTSIIAHAIRDEIRLIEPPRLYLGKAFWNKIRLMDFALQF